MSDSPSTLVHFDEPVVIIKLWSGQVALISYGRAQNDSSFRWMRNGKQTGRARGRIMSEDALIEFVLESGIPVLA